jgi:hypothetical protein
MLVLGRQGHYGRWSLRYAEGDHERLGRLNDTQASHDVIYLVSTANTLTQDASPRSCVNSVHGSIAPEMVLKAASLVFVSLRHDIYSGPAAKRILIVKPGSV